MNQELLLQWPDLHSVFTGPLKDTGGNIEGYTYIAETSEEIGGRKDLMMSDVERMCPVKLMDTNQKHSTRAKACATMSTKLLALISLLCRIGY